MKPEFSRQIFGKYSNIKLHENPSRGSRVVPYGRTDITELTVALRNFVNAPKNAVQVMWLWWKIMYEIYLTCASLSELPSKAYRILKQQIFNYNIIVICSQTYRIKYGILSFWFLTQSIPKLWLEKLAITVQSKYCFLQKCEHNEHVDLRIHLGFVSAAAIV
jgi:hypothetical protein